LINDDEVLLVRKRADEKIALLEAQLHGKETL
jgi:hypothetical protein